jgi:hypothetical protein
MSLIDTSFDDATEAPAAQVPTKVAPLIAKDSGSDKQKTEDILSDFSTDAAPAAPVPQQAVGNGLDDLMSFSPVVGKKVTAQ